MNRWGNNAATPQSVVMIAPPQTSLETATKKLIIQRMIADFRWHQAAQISNIAEIDPKRRSSQLLGVLDFYHLHSNVVFRVVFSFSLNQSLFRRERA